MEAAYFTRQIVQALIYIHGVGIVHRDLKPENMLFEKGSDVLKIIDFGIAVRKKEGERLTSRIGTPYYIAPEVLLKDYDERCDMWSLGVIVYMIVGFRPPFNGESEREVMESILNKEPSFSGSNFARTSRHFKDFMKRILMKNPKDRFTAAQAISHPWLRSAETSLISPVPKEEQQKTQ